GGGGSGGAAGGLKFTVADTCERIKEEFNFIQQQYHSLKLECEKLASEKTEMQRHYVMYYEMSYGLNVEMHKQRPPLVAGAQKWGYRTPNNPPAAPVQRADIH
ncbi:hypothetical protein HN011_005038, partial [Eciton burchellii]